MNVRNRVVGSEGIVGRLCAATGWRAGAALLAVSAALLAGAGCNHTEPEPAGPTTPSEDQARSTREAYLRLGGVVGDVEKTSAELRAAAVSGLDVKKVPAAARLRFIDPKTGEIVNSGFLQPQYASAKIESIAFVSYDAEPGPGRREPQAGDLVVYVPTGAAPVPAPAPAPEPAPAPTPAPK